MARLDLRKIKHVSRFDLSEKLGDKPLTIGRSSSNDVVLADTHVSRHHCIIESVDGHSRIRDLKSHGGTFVNGRKIEQSPLRHGDRITIGPFDLLFKDPSSASSSNGELPLALASDDSDNSRSATGTGLADASASALANDQPESRQAELDAREAALDQREAQLQTVKAQLDQRRTATLKQDADRITALQKELDQTRAEALIAADRLAVINDRAQEHDAIVAKLQSQVAASNAEREQAIAARDQAERALNGLRDQLSQLQTQIGEHASQVDELHAVIKTRQQQFDESDARFRAQTQSLGQSLEDAHREVERLKSHEATLQEQVLALESSRRIMAERSEQSNRALATLRAQVRTLDDAARRVSAIQARLAEIESAFIDLDQQLENAQDQDDDQLEQVTMQRQQISDELESLNEVRDAAMAQLSEHAEHLRAMTEHEVLQLATSRPSAREQSHSTRTMSAPSGRGRWWKFGR